MALQKPTAFISFSMVLLSAQWCVVCGLLLLASGKSISSKLRSGLATGAASVKRTPHPSAHTAVAALRYFHYISQDGKSLKRSKFWGLFA